MKSSPFSRSLAMMAAITSAMTLGADLKRGALSAIGTYESRGKGGKTPSRHVGTKANARAARKARNVRRHRAAGGKTF